MYQKELADLFVDLHFNEKLAIKKDYERESYIFVGLINNNEVVLKIFPKSSTGRVRNMEKEKAVDQYIDKHNKNFGLARAKIIETGISGKYFWSIRQYYPGNSLSMLLPNESLMGYDILRNEFIDKDKIIVPKIIDNLESLQKISVESHELNNLKKNFQQKYFEDLEDYNPENIGKYLGLSLINQQNFFANNKKLYYSNENIKACNSDMSPANIIVRPGDNIIFSDFEQFCFDNLTIDFTYLWLFLWRYENWQKVLIELFITNEKLEEMFRSSIIRILFHMHKWPSISLKIKTTEESKKIDRTHIWARYLAAAGDSFEAILHVR
ncbi:MAG: hypothetical protein WC080_00835 [Patescibacteria group bacterium]|jgi:hypothetical protein